MIECLSACAAAKKKPTESLHTSLVLQSQDRRGVGTCSTNFSDVCRRFRKLGCLVLEIITESELFRLFRRFVTDYDSVFMHNSAVMTLGFAALEIVMVHGRIPYSHA